MSRIRYLDISELNDRLVELEDLRDAVENRKEALAEVKAALEAHVPPTDGSDDVDLDDKKDDVTRAEEKLESAEADFDAGNQKELAALESLRDDIGSRGGKIDEDNEPFIHENDFENYARELADEIDAIPRGASWPCTCIDWEQAARELKMDYSTVEWEGDSYYYRS